MRNFAIISSKYLFLLNINLSSFWSSNYMHVRLFDIVPQVLWVSVQFSSIFFLLFLHIEYFPFIHFQVYWFSFLAVSNKRLNPSVNFFISAVFFSSKILISFFFLKFLFLCWDFLSLHLLDHVFLSFFARIFIQFFEPIYHSWLKTFVYSIQHLSHFRLVGTDCYFFLVLDHIFPLFSLSSNFWLSTGYFE